MPEAANDFTIMQFSTDALPERERATMLRDFYGPILTRLDLDPVPGGPIRFNAQARAVPGLAVSTVTFSAIRARRTPKLISDGNDDCMFTTVRAPGNRVIYRGRDMTPPEGAWTLLSAADPFACTTASGIAHGLTVSVPRKVMSAMVPRLEDQFGKLILDSPTLRLLTTYLGLLQQGGALAGGGLRRLVLTHVHDLLALTLRASRDAAEIARGRDLRAARLHAIKADILNSLGAQDLNLAALAARHGVTPRYVQLLFEDNGQTFSQFVLHERLTWVERMLRDPQQTRPIGAIALDAGFGDLSHFNRAFRRRYGETPSDVRARATGALMLADGRPAILQSACD